MSKAFEAQIAQVLEAPTDRFTGLIEIAGLDPAHDLRYADLRNVDFMECDLSGYNFTGAKLSGASFAMARVAGAVFDPEIYASGMLADAIDYAEALVPVRSGAHLGGSTLLNAPLRLQSIFLWQSELLKVVGCLRARKSVNIFGRPGSGKTLLLREAVDYIGRILKAHIITITSDSYDLSHALERQIESSQFVETSEMGDRIVRKGKVRHRDPIVVVDDGDRFSPEDLEKFVLICREANVRYIVVTSLPLWEMTEIDTLESGVRPIPISPHELTRQETAQIADVFPGRHADELGAEFISRQVEGLTARQIMTLAFAFYQNSNFDNAYHEAFSPELDLLKMSFQSDDDTRAGMYRILDTLCRAKGGSLTARDITGRTFLPLERVNSLILSLRQKGIVKRVKRRGYAFVTTGLLRVVRDNLDLL